MSCLMLHASTQAGPAIAPHTSYKVHTYCYSSQNNFVILIARFDFVIYHFIEAEIEWISTKGDGLTRPYFDNLDETFLDEEDKQQGMFSIRSKNRSTPKKKPRRETLRKVLLSSGFKLIQLPLEVGLSCNDRNI